mmetsp:Transcript_12679/g.29782  ORF Transcript_12679/g.29782 Transcript_12679/m.29782 type:complete len:243 (-) Transcript_12679:320-1048(-)
MLLEPSRACHKAPPDDEPKHHGPAGHEERHTVLAWDAAVCAILLTMVDHVERFHDSQRGQHPQLQIKTLLKLAADLVAVVPAPPCLQGLSLKVRVCRLRSRKDLLKLPVMLWHLLAWLGHGSRWIWLVAVGRLLFIFLRWRLGAFQHLRKDGVVLRPQRRWRGAGLCGLVAEVRLHLALAFELDLAAGPDGNAFGELMKRLLAKLDLAHLALLHHARGRVHGVAEQAVAWQPSADDARDNSP